MNTEASSNLSELFCAALAATDDANTPQEHSLAAVKNRAAAVAYQGRPGCEVIAKSLFNTAREHVECGRGKPEGPFIRQRREQVASAGGNIITNRGGSRPIGTTVNNTDQNMDTPTYTEQEISDASSRLRVDATALSWQTGKTFDQCYQLLRGSPLYAACQPQPGPPDPKTENRDGTVLLQLNRQVGEELKSVKRDNPEADYDACLTILRNRAPDLFRFESAEATLPEEDKTQLEIDRAIQRLRFNNRKLTYEQARNDVRTAQPHLFGLK
jgi:hypothetical protein